MEGNPAAAARGHGARRLRGRRRPRLRPRALRVPAAPSRRSTRRSRAARAQGLLGEDILGSGFAFDVDDRRGRRLLRRRRGDRAARAACRACAARSPRARRSRPSAACTACRPSSTTSRRSATSRSSRAHGADAYRALSPDATPGSKLVCFNERFAQPGRLRGPVRHDRCASCARTSPAACVDGRAIKALQIGGPLGGILPGSQARHARSTSTPLAAEGCMVGHGGIVAFDERDRHARRRHATCCTSAPHESCGKCFPCRIGLRRAHEMFARRRAGRPRAARGAARDARARQPVRPRRRHARADPQPARALPRRAGAGADATSRSTAPTVEVADGDDGPRRRARRRRAGPDALLRRAPGPVRRLPRLPGRRRGRARPDRRPARRRAATAWTIDTQRRRPRAASPRAVVELVLSELPEPPGAAHRAGRRSRATLGRRRAALAGRDPRAPTTTSAIPTWPSSTSCASPAGAACARATRSRATFALTATGRGFEANVAAGLDEGFRDSDLRLLRRLRRHLPDRRDHRDHPARPGRARATTMTRRPALRLTRSPRPAATAASAAAWRRTRATARSPRSRPALDGPANEGHTCLKGRFAHQFRARATA